MLSLYARSFILNIKSFYTEIYRLTDNVTPLPIDCGQLCNCSCCKGDEDMGMYLFPGERVMYEKLPSWAKISKCGIVLGGEKVDFISCAGSCDRSLRPLACRIFPLFPFIDIDGSLKIIMDPRGKGICPLAKALDIKELDKRFVNTVEYISKIMIKNSLLYSYLFELSRFTQSYTDFLKAEVNL